MSDSAVQIIAKIARADPGSITADTTLGSLGLNTSLGLGIVRSALERRFQRRLRPLTWDATVSSILAAIEVGAEGVAKDATSPARQAGPGRMRPGPSGPFGGRTRVAAKPATAIIGHGVDIQETASMPGTVGDGFADPFYGDHFTAAELAGAASRPDAKASLCGIWCAKEAIRKSHADLATLSYLDIEIIRGPDGRPLARIAGGPSVVLEISLSISHSGAYAVASAIVTAR